MKYVLMIVTFFIGALIPVQAILNARLGRQTGGALVGALLSFFTGLICLVILNFIVNANAMYNLRRSAGGPWYIGWADLWEPSLSDT
jgi:transporter family-2 protein